MSVGINPFFNAPFYLGMNNDLLRAGINTDEALWAHYIKHGAYEVINNPDAWRVPNGWFDVTHYLQLYPDLTQHGITAATALDHYYHYGIYENRHASTRLDLADFPAQRYAAANPDVALVVGVENEAGLLAHYLAYGYTEQREGAGSWGWALGGEVVFQVDGVSTGQALMGTVANDVFKIIGYVKNAVIDGVGGVDTAQFEGNVTTGWLADNSAVSLKNIEQITIKDITSPISRLELYTDIIPKLTLTGTTPWVTLQLAQTAISGQYDRISITNQSSAKVAMNGIEIIDLHTTASSTSTTLHANQVNHSSLQLHVQHQAGSGVHQIVLNSMSSPVLTTFVINGSASSGGLHMQASAYIDVFTGGTGEDIFAFTLPADSRLKITGTGAEARVVGVDTIRNFEPQDRLVLSNTDPPALTQVSFGTGDLASALDLEQVLSHEKVSSNTYLHWNQDTYIIINAAATAGVIDTDMSIIKIIGQVTL